MKRSIFLDLFFVFLFSFLASIVAGWSYPQMELLFTTKTASLHLMLLSFSLHFIYKKDWKTTLEGIGVPGNLNDHIVYTFIGIFAMFTLLFLMGMVSVSLGLNDQQVVVEKAKSLPLYLVVFAIVFAPISEEMFFRALLVPRFGVIIPALLFGLMHITYGSLVEIVGTFVIALVFGFIYKYSKSIVPVLAMHAGYNLLSLIVMRLVM